jgi:hypothetical protein
MEVPGKSKIVLKPTPKTVKNPGNRWFFNAKALRHCSAKRTPIGPNGTAILELLGQLDDRLRKLATSSGLTDEKVLS